MLKLAEFPAVTNAEFGWVVIAGAVTAEDETVMVAVLL
jgi:hypothetical protein